MNRVWSEIELGFIQRNSGKISDAEGARQLSAISGRVITVHAWRKKRQKMGQKKMPGRGVCKLAAPAIAGKVAPPNTESNGSHLEGPATTEIVPATPVVDSPLESGAGVSDF